MKEHHGSLENPNVSTPPSAPVVWLVTRKEKPGSAPVTLRVVSSSAFDARREASVLLHCDPQELVVKQEEPKP